MHSSESHSPISAGRRDRGRELSVVPHAMGHGASVVSTVLTVTSNPANAAQNVGALRGPARVRPCAPAS